MDIEFQRLEEDIPIADFVKVLKDQPATILAVLAVSCHRALLRLRFPVQVHRLVVRLRNYGPTTSLRRLKSNFVDKFIALRGNVVRVSNIKPLVQRMSFRCASCGVLLRQVFSDGKFSPPTGCVDRCKSKTFVPERSTAVVTDFQLVRMQEMVTDEEKDQGRIPRTIDCEFTGDLVDSCIPGDVVTLSGIVKARKTEIKSSKSKNKMLYVLYVDVNAVSNGKATDNGKLDIMQFTERDMGAIVAIANQKNLFKFIVNSLCPAIFGHEVVKAGLCLALFGGNRKQATSEKLSIRADSHVLVVGDPGLGKSQMLRACSRVAPRGVYVCGNTATTSGLTVTMVKEGSTGDYALEAGALVLADQGCCCIDEFDKMGREHSSLLEAMEQQSISLAKAGIVCTLASRCAVLAAANPVGGHYDRAKTVNENLKINTALLSRFDLVFILLDSPNQARDRLLSEHVIALHSGLHDVGETPRPTPARPPAWAHNASFASTQSFKPQDSLRERLSLGGSEKDAFDPLPHYLMRRYIAYARKYAHPRMSEEAKRVLTEYYLKLRKENRSVDGTPITTRQLESMVRLAEARARLELREVVTANDALDVVAIMTESLYDVFSDEFGVVDFRRNRGMSQGKKVKLFVKALNQEAKKKQSCMFTMQEMYKIAGQMGIGMEDFGRFVEHLNTENYILKKGAKRYQLQTGFT